jgi:cysteine desulfurase
MQRINLDQNATSPVDPEVLDAMHPFWLSGGNPESRHSGGRASRRAWTSSVETIARILGAEPDEVVLTSGGTEANNLAILGYLRRFDPPAHVLSSPIEHPAVSEPVKWLNNAGYAVDWSEVKSDGIVSASKMARLATSETRLAVLMRAHNETGALQPVSELATLLADRGIPVHTDAVQAVGRIPVNFHALAVSTLAASAHKLHGPAGIGALLVRKGTTLAPILLGGGQQKALRPGTPPVALAVGFARALELWERGQEVRTTRWRYLRDRLENQLRQGLGTDRVIRLGPSDDAQRLPQTLLLGFPDVDGEALLMQLDLTGIDASIGSACASGSMRPSPSLEAMRVPESLLRSSVRFSLGAQTSEAEIDEAALRVASALEPL